MESKDTLVLMAALGLNEAIDNAVKKVLRIGKCDECINMKLQHRGLYCFEFFKQPKDYNSCRKFRVRS